MVEGKEIGVVGRAIYQKLLPRLADTAKKGQIVVIDINSGDYEIADDDITATDLLPKRRPDAITWAGRVGYPAPYRMSARLTYGDEPVAQPGKFLAFAEIEELCSVLRVDTLRELSAEIIKASIDHINGKIGQLEYAEFLSSWMATAEETVAAGRNVNRIAARRVKNSGVPSDS